MYEGKIKQNKEIFMRINISLLNIKNMKKINIIILFSLLFTINGISQSKHSLGIEVGLHKKNNYYFPYKSFSPNSVYIGIPYEYKIAKRTSLIFKMASIANRDKIKLYHKINLLRYYAESKLNYLRFSFMFNQKIGNPNKFYGLIKMGVGMSQLIGGHYQLYQSDRGFYYRYISSSKTNRHDSNLNTSDFFSEGAIGFGINIYKLFDLQVTLNYITGVTNFNSYPQYGDESVPFKSLSDYEVAFDYARNTNDYTYKTNLYGGNITLMYNF